MEEVQSKKKVNKELSKNYPDDYLGLDFSFQGIKKLSNSLFDLTFLKELNLRGNDLEGVSSQIFKLHNLEILNLSKNKIKSLPKKIGKMINLKELILTDNLLSNLPMELGTLYNLSVLELSNNPLINPFNILYRDKKLLQYCREHNSNYKQPADRTWIDMVLKKKFIDNSFSIGTYNILANHYASKLEYPPTWILNPEYRKENVLHSICSFNLDILCLQEIEILYYDDFFKDQLELRCEYSSLFVSRGRAQIFPDSKSIDGCATFWKKSKFKLVESHVINYYNLIMEDNRFNTNHFLLNRYGKKDNISLITILESIYDKKNIIVVNVHLFWDPEYEDVKLLQSILLLEETEKFKNKYKNAPVFILGDFNSLPNSKVYTYLTTSKKVDFLCENFNLGFSSKININLNDAYVNEESDFTNFTPTFKGIIDYIFYTSNVKLTSILSGIENDYCERVVGLPKIHFPSDHILIASKFTFDS